MLPTEKVVPLFSTLAISVEERDGEILEEKERWPDVPPFFPPFVSLC